MKKLSLTATLIVLLIAPALAGGAGLKRTTLANPIKFRVGLQGMFANTWLLSPSNFDFGGTSHKFTTSMTYGLMTEIGFTDRIGIEVDFMFGKFRQKFDSDFTGISLETENELDVIDIPVLLRVGKIVYVEFGPQLTLINGAENNLTGTVDDAFKSTNIYGVFGLGGKFGIPTTKIGIRAGLRMGFGILDIEGVDASGNELTNELIFDELDWQRQAFVGIRLAVTYKLAG